MEKIEQKVRQLIDEGYTVKSKQYLEEAIEIFKRDPAIYIVFTLFFFGVIAAAVMIPLASPMIAPPFAAGYLIVAKKMKNRESYTFQNFFEGFERFAPLVLSSLLVSIFVFLGVFLLFPAVYFLVAYTFASCFLLEGTKDAWAAMELSRKLITRQFFQFFGFLLLLVLLNLVGLLFFGIGILATLPISYIAVYLAYCDIVGNDKVENTHELYL